MALRCEMIDFVRLYRPDYFCEAEAVAKVTVVSKEPNSMHLRVVVDVVYPWAVSEREPRNPYRAETGEDTPHLGPSRLL